MARTLGWADDAAARGSHTEALAWLRTIEAVGDQLPNEYVSKRERWQLAVREHTGKSPVSRA